MIFSGKSADGSDAREFHGMFINPENDNEWSSEPYTLEQKRGYTRHERFWDIMNSYGNSKQKCKWTMKDLTPLWARHRQGEGDRVGIKLRRLRLNVSASCSSPVFTGFALVA